MKKLIFRNFAKDTLIFFSISCLTIGTIVWTLQAVNYFDYVSQDGHGLKTYFTYILFNFPKIIHRIIPFIFFISLFYILNEYEYKNELQIFWTFGISKFSFANKNFNFINYCDDNSNMFWKFLITLITVEGKRNVKKF